jgi:hypothetical protein
MLIIQVSPQENDSLRGYFGCKNDEKCATHNAPISLKPCGVPHVGEYSKTICDPAE